MSLLDLIINNKLEEAKETLNTILQEKILNRLRETKEYLSTDVGDVSDSLDEDVNIQRMGRVNRIRRRIRRDSSGKMSMRRRYSMGLR